ncbi:MAG: hypothetical protein ACRDTG_20010 [Pseudonocardiaceae bacterium]
MAGDKFAVDLDGVRTLAGRLHQGISTLGDAARSVAPGADAGLSSAKVGVTLALIVQFAAGLIIRVEDTVGKIHASDGSYRDVDNLTGAELRRAGGG